MWLFVPGLSSPSAPDTAASNAASSLLAPEFDLWVLSSGKPIRLRSSRVEWTKAPWIDVLSGTIWNPSTAARTAAAWISSLPASPAKDPASPGSASASKTSDGYGPSSGERNTNLRQMFRERAAALGMTDDEISATFSLATMGADRTD